jgi:hypothetical protein
VSNIIDILDVSTNVEPNLTNRIVTIDVAMVDGKSTDLLNFELSNSSMDTTLNKKHLGAHTKLKKFNRKIN